MIFKCYTPIFFAGVASLAAALASTACGGGASPRSASTVAVVAPARSPATLHATRCGACHAPVEPRTRSRADLESALARHQKRLKLTSAEWRAMVEYLAAP